MKHIISAAAVALLLAGSALGQEQPQLELSLRDAVKRAVEQNLDVKAERYTPAQAEAEIRKNRAIYETHLTLDTSYQDSTTLPASTIASGSVSSYEQQLFNVTPGIYRLLQTGGTVGLAFNNFYTSTNSQSAFSLKDYWQSDLTITLNQPLLKNFGKETTELNILVSELSKESSLKSLKATILATVAKVRTEYYRLHSLRQDLESKQVSLELAQKILSDTEARVKAGVLPAMEILNAKLGVSSREKELIDSEQAVSNQVDLLNRLLRFELGRDIVPTDPPSRDEYIPDENEAVRRALADRPDLDDLKKQLEIHELRTRVARRQTLPSLNLNSSVALTGLGTTYSRDLDRVSSGDYPVWSIGLQLDYPLGNQSAENDYLKARLTREQTKLQIENLESSIATEVRIAVRAVRSGWKQLDVADRGRDYAEERMKSYLKKSEVGLATTKDLLDVQNDLSAARASQIAAQVAYSTAISLLWKTTGELLEREGIRVDAGLSDDLYRNAGRD